MDHTELVINLLGFWLMFILVLYVGVIFRVWAIRARYKDGYISYRRYQNYKRGLGGVCLKLLLTSIAITLFLGAIAYVFTPH